MMRISRFFGFSERRFSCSALCAALLLGGLLAQSALAQSQRDPTQVPGTAAPESSAAPGAQASVLGQEGMSVLVRDGVSYLVVGSRLYAKEQRVGGYTVERISETEVWLRSGSELRKIQRFAGIQRSAAGPLPPCTSSSKATPARDAAKCP